MFPLIVICSSSTSKPEGDLAMWAYIDSKPGSIDRESQIIEKDTILIGGGSANISNEWKPVI